MFKYLKQLFHNVVIQTRKLVSVTENLQGEIMHGEDEEVGQLENDLSSRLMNLSIADGRSCGSSRIDRTDCLEPQVPPIQLSKDNSWLEKSASEMCLKSEEETNEMQRNSNGNRIDESDNEVISLGGTEKAEGKCSEKGNTCVCENCSTVSEMNECGVCLEPLQTRGVRSCPLCANVVCSECATQLQKCAFCRIALPMQKNRAYERLLGKLSLPCRNARNGCQKLLKSETRLRHEASCHYASFTCPILRGNCSWQGSPSGILSHLKDVHDLKPLVSPGIAVEVSNFRAKSVDKLGECTVYMSCYDRLFAVKVIPYRKKLILTFYQLGLVGLVTEEKATCKYGVWIKVRGVGGGKTIKRILPFSKFDRETREIEIDGDRLFSKGGTSSTVADTVNIVISIRQVDNADKK